MLSDACVYIFFVEGKKKQEHNPNAPPLNRQVPFPDMWVVFYSLSLCIVSSYVIKHKRAVKPAEGGGDQKFELSDGEINHHSWERGCCLFTIYRYITNSQRDQLPVGLIAQLVEHCTGIAVRSRARIKYMIFYMFTCSFSSTRPS